MGGQRAATNRLIATLLHPAKSTLPAIQYNSGFLTKGKSNNFLKF